MFRPNLNCTLYNADGTHDLYGRPQPTVKARERCAIVKLITRSDKSSVRADSSGSRGSAHEEIADAVLLFTKTTAADIDDVVEVQGVWLLITGKFPRVSLGGKLDHYEIIANVWKPA